MDDMVNKENYTGFDNEKYTGSVRDYFSDNSNGRFKPQFDVVGPYTVDFSQYDPCLGYQMGDEGYDDVDHFAVYRITKAALDAADADVDFSQYDGDGDYQADLIYFIFAGNGSNYAGNNKGLWWPHRSVLFDIDKYLRRENPYIVKDNVYLTDYASSTELLSSKDLFPGTGFVHTLSNTTSPASLKTWSGKENRFSLKNITMSKGVIKFDVVDNSATGIDAVQATEGSAELFTLGGQNIGTSARQPGFYVVRTGNETKKVVVR